MTQVQKPYPRGFVVEETKLTRLVEIIHERLGEHQQSTTSDSFEVFLSDKQTRKMDSVEEVFNLENTRSKKIQRLLIACTASTAGAMRPEHEIQVDFDGRKNNNPKIEISTRSDVAGWADRALSAVEEQVERTKLQDTLSRNLLGIVTVSLLFIALIYTMLSTIQFYEPPRGFADWMWLHGADQKRVEQLLGQNHTLTDQEMREITTLQLRNVIEYGKPRPSANREFPWQIITIGVPVLIVFACSFYLLVACYPSAVFLWGDEIERYKIVRHHRNVVWGIIGCIVFGVCANLLFHGITRGLPSK